MENEIEYKKRDDRERILQNAIRCVCVDRKDEYGDLEDCFEHIARLWSAYCQVDIDAIDVGNMMILLKIVRAQMNPKHADNFVDIAGYAACAGEIAGNLYGK